jgi:hypothetical protein
MPVSRQFEESYYGYYGAPVYWEGNSMWGVSPSITHEREKWRTTEFQEHSWDPNLQSSEDVSGLSIHATNGDIGHVDDFIIDDETWAIRYLVLDTKKWLPGKKVLISPHWIGNISWDDNKVLVELSRDTIKEAPEYNADDMITREFETRLHKYYKRQGYWVDESVTPEYSGRYIR